MTKLTPALMLTALDSRAQHFARKTGNAIIYVIRWFGRWIINAETAFVECPKNRTMNVNFASSIGCLLLMLLALFGCDSPEKERLEQMRFLVETKQISEQYTSKLKQRLAENVVRSKELQAKYQTTQASHNRLLGKLKLTISNAQTMKEITLNDTTLTANVSSYLRYVDALDQSTADEKGFITSLLKSGGSAFASLLMKRDKAATRADLIAFIDSELMWVAWDEL